MKDQGHKQGNTTIVQNDSQHSAATMSGTTMAEVILSKQNCGPLRPCTVSIEGSRQIEILEKDMSNRPSPNTFTQRKNSQTEFSSCRALENIKNTFITGFLKKE